MKSAGIKQYTPGKEDTFGFYVTYVKKILKIDPMSQNHWHVCSVQDTVCFYSQ